MSGTRQGQVGEVKVGKFLMIDGEPCKVVSYGTAKTGKHGHAKATVVGVGILDGVKRTLVSPTHAKVDFPITERKAAQVLSIMGDTMQLMELVTYETFDMPIPPESEYEGTLAEGVEVEFMEVLGKRKLMRVR